MQYKQMRLLKNWRVQNLGHVLGIDDGLPKQARWPSVFGINAIPLNILTRARHEIGGFYLVRKKNGVFALSRNTAKYEGKTELYRASDIQRND
jgi:hypothetical protein